MRKISYTVIIEYIILLAITFVLGLFLFIVPPEHIRLNMLRICVAFLGFLSFLLVCKKTSFKYDQTYSFAKKYILVTVVISGFFVFYTSWLYDYTIYASLTLGIHYFWLLFSFGIIYVINHEKNKNSFWKKLVVVTLLFLLVRMFAWTSFNFGGGNLFVNFAQEYPDWKRNGLRRLIGGQTFQIAFIVILSDILGPKTCLKTLKTDSIRIRMGYFVLLFLFLYSVFITQARSGIVILLVTFMWTFILTRRKVTTKIMLIMMTFAGFGILLVCGVFDFLFNSFMQTGRYWLSTEARLEGLVHFWGLFKNIGHHFALGYVADGYTTEHLFYRTSWLRHYLGDLGIISAIFRFGIFTIPIYGWLFGKAIKVTNKTIKIKSPYSALITATSIYMILSCIISNMYDAQAAFAAPFYVAIISYVDGENKKMLRERV